MTENNKRFEDWTEVDCNQCARYWDSSCDGVDKGKRICQSFLATREVLIPAQIKKLNTRLDILGAAVVLLAIGNLFRIVGELLG